MELGTSGIRHIVAWAIWYHIIVPKRLVILACSHGFVVKGVCVCARALRPVSSELTADLSRKFLPVLAFKTVVIYFCSEWQKHGGLACLRGGNAEVPYYLQITCHNYSFENQSNLLSLKFLISFNLILHLEYETGYAVAQLVEALRYKPEFFIDTIIPAALWSWGQLNL
jgi:hypothetical protein